MPSKLIILASILMLASLIAHASAATTGYTEVEYLRSVLVLPDDQIDLARVKLSIDRMVEPAIDIDSALEEIDAMVADIQGMVAEKMTPENATSMHKLLALRTYLHDPGTWNRNRSFQYDLGDPLGTKIGNKLLTRYLTTKRGNCITMPILFAILGERLGLNVTLSHAPLHLFVKFTDDAGKSYNLEITSGAKPTREAWYREQIPMSDQAIANGVYLRPLTKKESVVAMGTLLMDHALKQGEYQKAIAVSDTLLEYDPKLVYVMVKKATAYYYLMEKYFISKYPRPIDIPAEDREAFRYLDQMNAKWFAKAEALGWQQPDRDYEEKYLKTVKQHAQSQQQQ